MDDVENKVESMYWLFRFHDKLGKRTGCGDFKGVCLFDDLGPFQFFRINNGHKPSLSKKRELNPSRFSALPLDELMNPTIILHPKHQGIRCFHKSVGYFPASVSFVVRVLFWSEGLRFPEGWL